MPSARPRGLLVLRRASVTIACVAAAWAAWLLIAGGFDATLLGIRIRSNNPRRVLLLAALALVAYRLAGGRFPVARLAESVRHAAASLARQPRRIAIALAVVWMCVIVAWSTRIAGGADSYGYVSQADLWLQRDLKIEQPWTTEVPWPDARWTFTPLGYRPGPAEHDLFIVPTYSPGLPIFMATAKAIAGQCALFLVVPLFGALAIVATFGIGRRLASPVVGLVGAWLVATSPVVIETAMEPLTDVPVMTAWALSFYFLLGASTASAAGAGLFGAIAILIRPNLFPLAVPLGCWFLVRRIAPSSTPRGRLMPAFAFGAGTLAGVAVVSAINAFLYGSPTTSGYGRFEDQLDVQRILPNLRLYASWFVEVQTPLALLGVLALAFPSRQVWPNAGDRRIFTVVGVFILVLWGLYLPYIQFDSSGYLRFLLPSWPFLSLGLAAVLVAAGQSRPLAVQCLVAFVVVALGAWYLMSSVERGGFDQQQAARHEVPLGELVRAHTPENSVVLAFERSGSIRYYAGRMTLRYDILDPAWLDRAVAWMTEHGVRVYAILDERHASDMRERFAGQALAGALVRPVFVYKPASTSLFDLSHPNDPARSTLLITRAPDERPGCDPALPLRPLAIH